MRKVILAVVGVILLAVSSSFAEEERSSQQVVSLPAVSWEDYQQKISPEKLREIRQLEQLLIPQLYKKENQQGINAADGG